jgi:hypothetical protein
MGRGHTNGEEHLINKEDKSYSFLKTNRFIQSRDIHSNEVRKTLESRRRARELLKEINSNRVLITETHIFIQHKYLLIRV